MIHLSLIKIILEVFLRHIRKVFLHFVIYTSIPFQNTTHPLSFFQSFVTVYLSFPYSLSFYSLCLCLFLSVFRLFSLSFNHFLSLCPYLFPSFFSFCLSRILFFILSLFLSLSVYKFLLSFCVLLLSSSVYFLLFFFLCFCCCLLPFVSLSLLFFLYSCRCFLLSLSYLSILTLHLPLSISLSHPGPRHLPLVAASVPLFLSLSLSVAFSFCLFTPFLFFLSLFSFLCRCHSLGLCLSHATLSAQAVGPNHRAPEKGDYTNQIGI